MENKTFEDRLYECWIRDEHGAFLGFYSVKRAFKEIREQAFEDALELFQDYLDDGISFPEIRQKFEQKTTDLNNEN